MGSLGLAGRVAVNEGWLGKKKQRASPGSWIFIVPQLWGSYSLPGVHHQERE